MGELIYACSALEIFVGATVEKVFKFKALPADDHFRT
jgi:hypothetical protein